MKKDRWKDSRTIKRGRVLVLDGSLVPFCSKYLVACMRANFISRKWKLSFFLSTDYLRVDSPAQKGGRSAIHL